MLMSKHRSVNVTSIVGQFLGVFNVGKIGDRLDKQCLTEESKYGFTVGGDTQEILEDS